MVDVDKAVLARLQKNGRQFEILVDAELAAKAKEDLKKGKNPDMSDVLAVDAVFFDAKKGTRAGKRDLVPVFDTEDASEIAKIILKEGKLSSTEKQRTDKSKEKWDRIVALISMNAIDAKTKLPIPAKTIEDALRKSFFRIDENKRVEDQMEDAVKKLKAVIPMSFEQRTVQIISIAPNVVTPCLNICKSMGTITKETWNEDKSLTLVVKLPAGLREEFIDRLNAITHGNAEIKLID